MNEEENWLLANRLNVPTAISGFTASIIRLSLTTIFGTAIAVPSMLRSVPTTQSSDK